MQRKRENCDNGAEVALVRRLLLVGVSNCHAVTFLRLMHLPEFWKYRSLSNRIVGQMALLWLFCFRSTSKLSASSLFEGFGLLCLLSWPDSRDNEYLALNNLGCWDEVAVCDIVNEYLSYRPYSEDQLNFLRSRKAYVYRVVQVSIHRVSQFRVL